MESGRDVLPTQSDVARGTVPGRAESDQPAASAADRRAPAGENDFNASKGSHVVAPDQYERTLANGLFRADPHERHTSAGRRRFQDGEYSSLARQSVDQSERGIYRIHNTAPVGLRTART